MALLKSTLDELNAHITGANGALIKGESDVTSQLNTINGGGEITQADLIKLQWAMSRYTITASVFGNIMTEFTDSLKQGANRIS